MHEELEKMELINIKAAAEIGSSPDDVDDWVARSNAPLELQKKADEDYAERIRLEKEEEQQKKKQKKGKAK